MITSDETKTHINNDLDCALKTTETIINCARQICKDDEVNNLMFIAEERLDYIHKNFKLVKKEGG